MAYTLTDEQWTALDPDDADKLADFETGFDEETGTHTYEGYPDINGNDVPDFLEGSSSGSNVTIKPSHYTEGT